MSNDQFSDPASTAGIAWDDLKGALLLIKPHAVESEIKTQYGEASAVRADVFVLDGDEVDAEYLDTLIFPKVLQGQVKSRIGGMVLGRLGQGQKKPGQSPPWVLSEATDADKVVGREYLSRTAEVPF